MSLINASVTSTFLPPREQMFAEVNDRLSGFTVHEDGLLRRKWLLDWSREVLGSPFQVLPSVQQIVADLLANGVQTWPEVRSVNVYDLRVQWGHLMRLSPAPWCTHGRRLGVAAETCLRCELDHVGLETLCEVEWLEPWS